MKNARVRLVGNSTMSTTYGREDCDDDPAQRIFEHWVWMLGKNPRRTAFGPARRKSVDRALSLYDADTLLLAIDGCAASAWHNGENDRARPFNDLDLILRDESHIERFADDGERVRRRAVRLIERQRAADVAPRAEQAEDPERVRAARDAVRRVAAALAGRIVDA